MAMAAARRRRAAGVADALRLVLRRAPPRRVPRAGRRRGRHPLRERGGDPRPDADPRPRRRPSARCAGAREIVVDHPLGARLDGRDRRRHGARCRPRRSSGSSTPPAPATSTPPASSTASPTGRPLAECAALGSLAAAEVISHLGARPQADLAALAAAARLSRPAGGDGRVPRVPIADSITDLIGRTPLVRLGRIADGSGADDPRQARVVQPGRLGEGPHRPGDDRGRRGRRATWCPGESVIVEPTSGNTGIALAFVCAAKGYRCILTMPETMSVERRTLLRAYGAELVLTPGAEGMRGAIAKAEEIAAQIDGAFMPQQFQNPANPEIHRRTTAEEIWADTDGEVDVLVAGRGHRRLDHRRRRRCSRERRPGFRAIAVEPVDSPGAVGRHAGAPQDPGHRRRLRPRGARHRRLRRGHRLRGRRRLRDGAAPGPRGGHPGRHLARARTSGPPSRSRAARSRPGKTIVTFLCDTGERYLTTPLFAE